MTDFRSVGCAKSVLRSGALPERAEVPALLPLLLWLPRLEPSSSLLVPKRRRSSAVGGGSGGWRWCRCREAGEDAKVRCQDIGPGTGSLDSVAGSALHVPGSWAAAAVVGMPVSCAGQLCRQRCAVDPRSGLHAEGVRRLTAANGADRSAARLAPTLPSTVCMADARFRKRLSDMPRCLQSGAWPSNQPRNLGMSEVAQWLRAWLAASRTKFSMPRNSKTMRVAYKRASTPHLISDCMRSASGNMEEQQSAKGWICSPSCTRVATPSAVWRP